VLTVRHDEAMSKPATTASKGDVRTLIVMYDGSQVAAGVLPLVHQLVGRTGADVRLITSTLDGTGATPVQLAEAESELAGLAVERVVVDDRPAAEAAVDLASRTDGGLLCLSTHGRSGIGRAVLGSVADGVIRSGRVPVLVVGPNCDTDALDRPGPVALCIDGSARSDRVLDEGIHWARLLDRDVRMILVSSPFDGATRQASTDMFSRLEQGHPSPDVQVSGYDAVNGSVAWGLVTEADRVKAPLIVISPTGRTGWERLLAGSATLALLRSATCPVLVLASGSAPGAAT
jgi:nucleotide-binding universal stress UspA family protein